MTIHLLAGYRGMTGQNLEFSISKRLGSSADFLGTKPGAAGKVIPMAAAVLYPRIYPPISWIAAVCGGSGSKPKALRLPSAVHSRSERRAGPGAAVASAAISAGTSGTMVNNRPITGRANPLPTR